MKMLVWQSLVKAVISQNWIKTWILSTFPLVPWWGYLWSQVISTTIQLIAAKLDTELILNDRLWLRWGVNVCLVFSHFWIILCQNISEKYHSFPLIMTSWKLALRLFAILKLWYDINAKLQSQNCCRVFVAFTIMLKPLGPTMFSPMFRVFIWQCFPL